jgi:tRNA(Ile)-lysidine synthase
VAVSGGSDSLALMRLLAGRARRARRPAPLVATVDHALRPGSKAEAKQVAAAAKTAGLKAVILTRKGEIPAAGLEAFARDARYRLLGAWAKKAGVKTVFVAHTQDDQAETLLLRLMRGSGVDGLAAMRPTAPWPVPGFAGLVLARPLLGFTRAELQAFLRAAGEKWIDDPMNEDARFARVRLRQAWPELERLGFSKARLARTAAHLAGARDTLERAAEALSARLLRPTAEGLLLDAKGFAGVPAELFLRVLAAALMAVSGRPYRPRFERLVRLSEAILGGTLGAGRTLHGCKIGPAPRRLAPKGTNLLLVRRETGRKAVRPRSKILE